MRALKSTLLPLVISHDSISWFQFHACHDRDAQYEASFFFSSSLTLAHSLLRRSTRCVSVSSARLGDGSTLVLAGTKPS